MNVVDSSGWLEYLSDSSTAEFFAEAIENTAELIVPSITIYEVFKRVLQQRGEEAALQATAMMLQGRIIELDQSIAMSAAAISCESKTAMADSIILATARAHHAILWTQDIDLKGFDNIRYIAKAKQP